jgi:hypothetical protein
VLLWTRSGGLGRTLQQPAPAVDIEGMLPGGISPANLFIGFLAAMFLVMPIITLVHELAHAVVALRVSSDRVLVLVGGQPAPVRINGRRLQINWSPLPMRGVRGAGVCIWQDESSSPSSRLAVAVAGPFATALLIPLFLFLMVKSIGMPDWVPATWGVSALIAFISVLFNADPRPANAAERAGHNIVVRDGPRALAAFRAWRGSAMGTQGHPAVAESAGQLQRFRRPLDAGMPAPLRERVANGWSALTGSTRRAGGYRLANLETSQILFLLRGREGPQSGIAVAAEDARGAAAQIREVLREGPGGRSRRAEGVHERDLTIRERATAVIAQLSGKPRWANVWAFRYRRLWSGTELVQVELGTTREANAHSILPLTLDQARLLADQFDGCADRATGTPATPDA